MAQQSKYFASTTNPTTENVKTLFFTAVLTKVTAQSNGKALLTFNVTGHPHRSEYSKTVSLKYLEDMFEIFNSYLNDKLEEFDADHLLDRLIEEKSELRMWSKSQFDRTQNKYVTDSSFIGI